jgi:hypothetical protein
MELLSSQIWPSHKEARGSGWCSRWPTQIGMYVCNICIYLHTEDKVPGSYCRCPQLAMYAQMYTYVHTLLVGVQAPVLIGLCA